MRARVIVSAASPEVIEKGVPLTKEVLVPAARQQPGYRGYIAIYDKDRGVGMQVTLWEDEQTEQASDEAMRGSREQYAKAFDAQVRVEKYEVAIAEVI